VVKLLVHVLRASLRTPLEELDKEHRWSHLSKPIVVVGKCRKADVFGYCNGRKEQEIVIDPKKIMGVRVLKDIGPSPFNAP
jgi:hypothetical protein